ncbi:MAG: MlaA family lipoprotein, partial [Stellaceae bacterium]
DLGVTFAVWGIGSGPYLILPILGPSNVRDAIGMAGDGYADPGNIIASDNHVVWAAFARAGTEGIDVRSRNIKTLADIERTSLDYYATIRSLYRQRRAAQIRHEYTDIPNVSPVQGGDDTAAPPISYQVAPGSPPVEAPKK